MLNRHRSGRAQYVLQSLHRGDAIVHMGRAPGERNVVVGPPAERRGVHDPGRDLAVGDRGSLVSRDGVEEHVQAAAGVLAGIARELLPEIDIGAVESPVLKPRLMGDVGLVSVDVENTV